MSGIETHLTCVVVPQTSAGRGRIKHTHHLRADRSLELALASQRPITSSARHRATAEEFRGIFSHATIQRFVDEAIASQSGARIKDYIPLFVNRFARERLEALAQVQGQWAKGTASR